MLRLGYSLRFLLLLPAIFAVLAAMLAYRSHEQTVLGNARYKAYYRGLGWTNDSGITGRRYYAFTIDDSPFRMWVISYSSGEYANAVCKYPDGTLAIEGECRVEFTMNEVFPLIDELRNARSYSPDGKHVATVADGTGRAMWFYPDGTLNWDVHYSSGKRTLLRHYNPDGMLLAEIENPDNGQPSHATESAAGSVLKPNRRPRETGELNR